jgi:hypothetical protein
MVCGVEKRAVAFEDDQAAVNEISSMDLWIVRCCLFLFQCVTLFSHLKTISCK